MNGKRITHVAHVVFDLGGGGLEGLVATMGARFEGTDVRVSVLVLSGRAGHVGERVASRFYSFDVVRSLPAISMLRPTALVRALRRLNSDVVHVHSGCWYKGATAARLARVRRVIFTEHGREHKETPVTLWLARRALRHTDVVVAVSDRLADYMVRVVGVEPAKVRTIPNGVDTEAFRPGAPSDDLRRHLGIPAGAIVVGSVGRLEPVKAYHRLIEAVASLSDRGIPPVYLVICGDGSERGRLEDLATSKGLADRLRLPGWIDDAAVYYRLFDVFALTSRSEGASVSLLEAMASGVAPIVTDVGANRTSLGPELGSQAIPANDQEPFVAALTRVVRDRGLRLTLGRMARARVVGHYGLDQMLDAYRRLYTV